MRAADYAYFEADGPLALAHRGGAQHRGTDSLENTLAAFAQAVRMGFTHLETDVHATADGVVVAFHDTHLDRVTDATGAVADRPWSQVRRARIGGREPIPALAEVLDAFPDTRLNIDVKDDRALEPTVAVLRRHRALDRVCLGSFSERRIRQIRRMLGPSVATAAGQIGTGLLRLAPVPVSRLVHTSAPALQVPVRHRVAGRRVELVTPALLGIAHRLGKHVHVWFGQEDTEDAAEFHRLLDLGVDGLVVDRLSVLEQVYAERGHPLHRS